MSYLRNVIILSVIVVLSCVLVISSVQAALTGLVSGKVVTGEDVKLKGVKVTLKSLDGSNPDRTVETSKSGRYRFTNVTPGRYIVFAAHDGYVHRNSQVIRVSSNGKVKLCLFMDVKSDDPEPEPDSINEPEQEKSPSAESIKHNNRSDGSNTVSPGKGLSGGSAPGIQRP